MDGQANGFSGASKPSDLTQYLEFQIDNLRGAVVDELCSLRRDIDVLRSGGWQVKVGPFENTKTLGPTEVATIHHQIAARLSQNATLPNRSLYLDGVSEDGGVKQDSPMRAARARYIRALRGLSPPSL